MQDFTEGEERALGLLLGAVKKLLGRAGESSG